MNPHGREPGGFSYPLQLSLPSRLARFTARERRFGVWTIPSPYCRACLQVRCCPSSLYTFLIERNSDQAWLGIAMLKVSPTLSSSTSAVSRTSTQVWFESTASAIPPRSHRWLRYSRRICVPSVFYSVLSLGFFCHVDDNGKLLSRADLYFAAYDGVCARPGQICPKKHDFETVNTILRPLKGITQQNLPAGIPLFCYVYANRWLLS